MIAARAKIGEIPDAATNKTAPQRVLAIDYGRKRIGLALSDELGLTAQPLAVFVRTNRRNDFRRLRDICRAHAVRQIVVGHPVRMSGEASPMADEAERFAARLEKELGIPVDLHDERLTSWEAGQLAAETKPSSRRKRGPLDDVAAAILLREYLERQRGEPSARAKNKE
ncbi:MAG TPA: Holliday junction resolvase RuvX [Candidatus Acidoferrum sp.]|nr:Holliday junction resolvase RuvX [Candidatus Acidoferrum sp.]